MIKILRIINRFNLGGPTYNAAYLTKYMPNEYSTLLMGGVPEEHEVDSLHIVKSLHIEPVIIPEMSRSINGFNDFKSYLLIRKMIQNYKPDIVHTHASKAGLLGRLAAVHEKVPVIVHTFHGHIFHSYFNSFITNIFLKTERYLAKKSNAVIAISHQQKRELAELLKISSPDKFEIIPLGLDLKKFSEDLPHKRSVFRQMYNIADDIIAIGIVGRLVPVKNHYLLIDAVKLLKTLTDKKFEIIIIGDGDLKKKLMQYVKDNNMSYRTNKYEANADFYFTSWIKEMDMAYAGLDIVTLCSKNEGTPVSLLEAQAAGRFIVTTNVGGVQDILKKEAGIIVNGFLSSTFAHALLNAIENFAHQNIQIHSVISPVIIEKYSYERLVKNMDQLYKNLLRNIDNK